MGFGGLGVREGGFILFFGALGVSDERALAFGLSTYLITVVVSAIGAPSFALGGGRRELRLDAAHVRAADRDEHRSSSPTNTPRRPDKS